MASDDIKLFNWIANGRELDEMTDNLIRLFKQLLVLTPEEVFGADDEANRMRVLYMVENGYNYWRSKQRFALVSASSSASFAFGGFMEIDDRFNQMVVQLYRTLEEKLQGHKNLVYRQLQAGTNCCAVTQNYKTELPSAYSTFRNVPFISSLIMRTPILFHPLSTRREGTFEEVAYNPLKKARINIKEWLCYPAKVGDLLCFVYFHRDFCANGFSLGNLFELASDRECMERKPDLICMYGNMEDESECIFHYDEDNDIWVGSVAHDTRAEYFGYMKKMILTLHNLRKMQQRQLPIHGSMMEIFFENYGRKSIILVGDSGAGKSETIEVIKKLSAQETGNRIKRIQVVFDDMGSLNGDGQKVTANGTETGAFVRLDDLDKGTAYRDMDRSIFFNPETSNARVVLPITNYQMITAPHEVDMILYANNYEEKTGIRRFENYEEAREVFCAGKRMALGTTSEKGLSSTFFANPFGPAQKSQLCSSIMEDIFGKLYEQGTYVGEIYTNLGTDNKERIVESGRELLKELQKV